MPEIPSSNPRHIVHGTAAAFTTAAGVPRGFKFVYGSWSSPDAQVGQLNGYGVIQNYTLTKIGDVSNLKDGGGSTFAHAVIDPGWKITASILHAYTDAGNASPRQGGRINFKKLIDNAPGTLRPFTAVATAIAPNAGKAKFTVASTTGYVVGEIVTVTGTYTGSFAVISVDSGTAITLDTPFGVTSAGNLSAPASTVVTTLKAVVTGLTVKWEAQGWRMLEIEAEARDSINLGTTYGTFINEVGSVTSTIYDGS
jgi:hypothetical protein